MAPKIRGLAGNSKTTVPLHGWSSYPRAARSGSNRPMETTMASNFNSVMARAALLDLAKALTSRDAALRRDECGEWRIDGRGGHVYAVPGTLDDPDRPGFMIHVLSEKLERGTVDRWTSQGWTYAKRALSFATLIQDGDLEGVFFLDRLPSRDEAERIRHYCVIPKKRELSEEELARLRRHSFQGNKMTLEDA
jgi:hypothetical protein